jgi:hypothetical protein
LAAHPTATLTKLNFRASVYLMATRKRRPGRPTVIVKAPDFMRYIPLIMRHGDVQKLDRAAAKAGLSRAEWVRRILLAAVQ